MPDSSGVFKITDTSGNVLDTTQPVTSNTFSVYQALCDQELTGCSLYDKYANPTHKDSLRKYVTGATPWSG